LPEHLSWLEEYVNWHRSARRKGGISGMRLLVIKCTGHCGGLSDRIRDLPYYLWEAHRTKRLFLIEWQLPWPIENFLWPAAIDWTVPPYLAASPRYQYVFDARNLLPRFDSYTAVEVEPGHALEGMSLMWRHMGLTPGTAVPEVYSALIRLSPPVRAVYESTLDRLNLKPGRYVAAHLRARYPGVSDKFRPLFPFARSIDADGFMMTKEAKAELRRMASHAVDCVLERSSRRDVPNGTAAMAFGKVEEDREVTVYFASDSNDAVRLATTEQLQLRHRPDNATVRVVGMVMGGERLHLDYKYRIVNGIRRMPPSAFYPTFVDLYILAGAACRSVGMGGYGVQSAIMGGTECLTAHQDNGYFRSLKSAVNVSYCLDD